MINNCECENCTCENCKCREVKDEPEGLVVDETGECESCQ